MTRDHLLGFPAVLRQHDEPVPAPKKPTVKERPAAFVAFETGNHLPAGMLVGVDLGTPGGDKTSIMTWGPLWDQVWSVPWAAVFKTETREGPKNIVLDPKPPKPAKKDALLRRPASGGLPFVTGDWGQNPPAPEATEIAYGDVFDTIRKLVTELGKPATKDILAEFGAQKGTELKPEQWAEFIATAERRLDGWIKWSGGKRPVGKDVRVEVRFRDNATAVATESDHWVWQHDGSSGDIVEYRVIK